MCEDFFDDCFEMALALGLGISEEMVEEEGYLDRVEQFMERGEGIDGDEEGEK